MHGETVKKKMKQYIYWQHRFPQTTTWFSLISEAVLTLSAQSSLTFQAQLSRLEPHIEREDRHQFCPCNVLVINYSLFLTREGGRSPWNRWFQLWQTFRTLASLIRSLHSSLFAALFLHPLIPSSCRAYLWITSAHLVLGLPTCLTVWKFPFKTFFGILCSSIEIYIRP